MCTATWNPHCSTTYIHGTRALFLDIPKELMKRYHPETALSAEEKLRRVAAVVGLAMPKDKSENIINDSIP